MTDRRARSRTRPLFAAMLFALAGVDALHADGDARDAIEALNARWIEAYETGNYAVIPDLYTEDALIMPRGRRAIEGREALRKALGGLAAGRTVEIDVEIVELEVFGRHAWLVSRFAVTYTNPDDDTDRSSQHGRSLIIYRLGGDGQWRIHRDMDSPAPPPSAPAEADHG